MATQDNADEIKKKADEKAVEPMDDLVYSGGYRGNPREIVENPAVTPQMYDPVEDFHAGDIRDERDEEGEDVRYLG
ncbi:MAG TPA: hypothetical protein V6D29_22390 [Leptolyngbyaceae cyanobacterium]